MGIEIRQGSSPRQEAGPSAGADSQSAGADSFRRPKEEIQIFARGLKRTFQYGLNEAKERLEAAETWLIEELKRKPTDEELIGSALRDR